MPVFYYRYRSSYGVAFNISRHAKTGLAASLMVAIGAILFLPQYWMAEHNALVDDEPRPLAVPDSWRLHEEERWRDGNPAYYYHAAQEDCTVWLDHSPDRPDRGVVTMAVRCLGDAEPLPDHEVLEPAEFTLSMLDLDGCGVNVSDSNMPGSYSATHRYTVGLFCSLGHTALMDPVPPPSRSIVMDVWPASEPSGGNLTEYDIDHLECLFVMERGPAGAKDVPFSLAASCQKYKFEKYDGFDLERAQRVGAIPLKDGLVIEGLARCDWVLNYYNETDRDGPRAGYQRGSLHWIMFC